MRLVESWRWRYREGLSMPVTYRPCCCGLQSSLGAPAKGHRIKMRGAGIAASKLPSAKFLSAALMACMWVVSKVHPHGQPVDPD